MKLESFWLDTAPTFNGAEEGPVDGRADVAIIGGGFTGLSTALALAKRGATVVVLEAGRLVGEASGPQRRPMQRWHFAGLSVPGG